MRRHLNFALECLAHKIKFTINGLKTPPVQFAKGQRDRAPSSIGTSWSGMQQEHAICTWALTCMHRSCAQTQIVFLLHPAPTCVDGCWCPVPLTCSNLHWWCCSFKQLAQTLYLHLWWLPTATCTGGELITVYSRLRLPYTHVW